MIRALFFKEWIKTRRYLVATGAVTLACVAWSLLRIARVVTLKGAAHLWEVMLQRDAVFIEDLQFMPLAAGILLAVVQYAPEMHRKQLKLTLHLPLSARCTTFAMLLFGLCALLLLFGTHFLLLALRLDSLLAPELTARILLTALPWYLAGAAGYLLAAWAILEPAWRRRTLNLAVAALLLPLYFQAPGAEAYNAFLPLLALFSLCCASLVWLSVVRFSEGCQD